MTPVIKTPQKRIGRGSFGSYYKMSKKVGVKVIRNLYNRDSLHEFFEEFLDFMERGYDNNLPDITEAAQELVALQMLEKSRKTPKPIGLCWIDCGFDEYRIGIQMEHINGKTMLEYDRDEAWGRVNKLEEKWATKLKKKFGIEIGDWHEENVMMRSNGRWVRIDFSPGYFDVSFCYRKEFIQRIHHEVLKLMESCPA